MQIKGKYKNDIKNKYRRYLLDITVFDNSSGTGRLQSVLCTSGTDFSGGRKKRLWKFNGSRIY